MHLSLSTIVQMRTVRADGTLVVQHRGCRLIKPSVDDDTVARLLRDDDTVVADFKLSQLQRVNMQDSRGNVPITSAYLILFTMQTYSTSINIVH